MTPLQRTPTLSVPWARPARTAGVSSQAVTVIPSLLTLTLSARQDRLVRTAGRVLFMFSTS